jgi:hypothetical protein
MWTYGLRHGFGCSAIVDLYHNGVYSYISSDPIRAPIEDLKRFAQFHTEWLNAGGFVATDFVCSGKVYREYDEYGTYPWRRY